MTYDTEYDRTLHGKMVYDWAVRSKKRLYSNDTCDVRELITIGMVPFPGTSYESDIEIWFGVFRDDADMCERFRIEITERNIQRQQYEAIE